MKYLTFLLRTESKVMLSILDVIDSTVIYGNVVKKKMMLIDKMKALESKYDMTKTSFEEIKRESISDYELAKEIEKSYNTIDNDEVTFNIKYRQSLKKLIQANGLPVHINAFDIHAHNIDVDSIKDITKVFAEGEEFTIIDMFDDKSHPAFSNAPYNFCFLQIENKETYNKGIGQVIKASNEKNTTYLKKLKEQGLTEEQLQEFLDLSDSEMYAVVQHYALDDYIQHLHLFKDGEIGIQVNNTILSMLEGVGDDTYEEFKEKIAFIQIYDLLNNRDDGLICEEQVITWLDSNGTPLIQKCTKFLDVDDTEVTSNSNFYVTACEKIFQWCNSDNDLLEQADIKPSNSWSKKIRKTYKGKNKPSLFYKTLRVNSKIKVIDGFGVERSPQLREIAQHTRRGHWAHYGINGNGKLFGKYTKSVYRKPKTIGKLSNGLIIKDYTLEKSE